MKKLEEVCRSRMYGGMGQNSVKTKAKSVLVIVAAPL